MFYSAVLFLLVFLFYLVHTAPTVYFGDCGDLLSAVLTGGIPHSTGFPGYLLLGTLTSAIAKSAFWINAVSGLAAAASCLMLFHFTRAIFTRLETSETSFLARPRRRPYFSKFLNAIVAWIGSPGLHAQLGANPGFLGGGN